MHVRTFGERRPEASAAHPVNARVTNPGAEWEAREFGMTGVDDMVAAAARQPVGTLMLRSDSITPAERADEVLA